ncbi:WD40 repeat domain-containing protein [Stratiformator vulcanicus]|uniref:WD domain, G-beta repeat n=1 Tax=Stratiformator vulcanicus TaxID=2527980 RepID=A0A517R6R1_9PLAN|nr:WD40 repeat domain-containing protein [Stratiformator vulcanicus]QDT39587.1 WD domain, G-beta repeat [Stratiformator vulcanicus]
MYIGDREGEMNLKFRIEIAVFLTSVLVSTASSDDRLPFSSVVRNLEEIQGEEATGTHWIESAETRPFRFRDPKAKLPTLLREATILRDVRDGDRTLVIRATKPGAVVLLTYTKSTDSKLGRSLVDNCWAWLQFSYAYDPQFRSRQNVPAFRIRHFDAAEEVTLNVGEGEFAWPLVTSAKGRIQDASLHSSLPQWSLYKLITQKLVQQFIREEFDKLEQFDRDFGVGKSEEIRRNLNWGGVWPDHVFDHAVGSFFYSNEEERPVHLGWLQAWKTQFPESAIPDRFLGRYYINWAWAARGSGYAIDVSPDDSEKFLARLETARTHLEQARQMPAHGPYLYADLIKVAKGLGEGPPVIYDLIDGQLDRCPWSITVTSSAAGALLPRWGGSAEEIQKLAKHLEKRTSRTHQQVAYATIARTVTSYNGKSSLSEFGFDYDKLLGAVYDRIEVYPDNDVQKSMTLSQLLNLREYDRAKQLLRELGTDAAPGFFKSRQEWERLVAYANADYEPPAQVACLMDHSAKGRRVMSARFSPDGSRLVAADQHNDIYVYETGEFSRIAKFHLPMGSVRFAHFGPTKDIVWIWLFDGRLIRWTLDPQDAASGFRQVEIAMQVKQIKGNIDASRDGRVVITSDNTNAQIYDLELLELRHEVLRPNGATLFNVSISGDGKEAISSGIDRGLTFIDCESGKVKSALSSLAKQTPTLGAVSDPGKKYVASMYDLALRIHDRQSEEIISEQSPIYAYVRGASSSPVGAVASIAGDSVSDRNPEFGGAWVVRLGRGERWLKIPGHVYGVQDVDFSPDGKYLVTAGNDLTTRIWDVEKLLKELPKAEPDSTADESQD